MVALRWVFFSLENENENEKKTPTENIAIVWEEETEWEVSQ